MPGQMFWQGETDLINYKVSFTQIIKFTNMENFMASVDHVGLFEGRRVMGAGVRQ
jgi:hypothetical protein